jgi:hypothetical protein
MRSPAHTPSGWTSYRFWAAQLGIPFDKLAVRVEGDLDIRGFFGFDDTVRPGFTAVRGAIAAETVTAAPA